MGFGDDVAKEAASSKLGTLVKLLERSGIDPDDFARVERVKVYQGYYKDNEGDAHTIDMGGITLVPHWVDGPEWPVVQPAAPTKITYGKRPAARKDGARVTLILPDPQFGFLRHDDGDLTPMHDEAAITAAFAVGRLVKPQHVVCLGDLIDMSEWSSKFVVLPEFVHTTQPALDRAHQFLAEQRAMVGPEGDVTLISGNHDCLSTDARAITPHGYKAVDDLHVGDLVLSCTDAGISEWVPIEAIHVYDVNTELVSFRTSRLKVDVTNNHRMVGLASNGPVGQRRWVERPAGRFLERTAHETFGCLRSDRTDYPISDDDIRLAAWCFTDSWIARKDTPSPHWEFSQRVSASHRIADLLTRLGIGFSSYDRHRQITEIDGKPVRSHEPERVFATRGADFHRFPMKAKDRLPEWVFLLSERQVDVFLEELQWCDGTTPTNAKSAKVLYVSDQHRREDVQRLLVMNGWLANANEYRPGHWRLNICRPSVHGTARLDTSGGRGVSSRHYEGRVWCLTVPYGRFMVESHGTVHLSGNSRLGTAVARNAKAALRLRQANNPEAWPVLSLGHLLRLDELAVEYVNAYPAGRVKLASGHGRQTPLYAIHGEKLDVKKVAETERQSFVQGHVHRVAVHMHTYEVDGQPQEVEAWSLGALCRTDGAVPSTRGGYDDRGRPVLRHETWQQAVGVLTEFPEGGWSLEPVRIHDGVAYFRGQVVTPA